MCAGCCVDRKALVTLTSRIPEKFQLLQNTEDVRLCRKSLWESIYTNLRTIYPFTQNLTPQVQKCYELKY